jgi:predicted RNase H-like HicB family nuclease
MSRPLNRLSLRQAVSPEKKVEFQQFVLSVLGAWLGEGYMHNEFTAIIEKDGDWYIAYCAEIPGANGQGKTREECLDNLREAIELILEDRKN